jgi:polyphosphate glucokinase
MASTKQSTLKTQPAKKKNSSKKIAPPPGKSKTLKTLAFDIGGSGLKASLLNEKGEMITERVRIETPRPCPPPLLLEKFKALIAQLPPFDRISVGFPGVVRYGITLGCANLGNEPWVRYNLQSALSRLTGKPVRVINDADMQGLGAIRGKGVELVITLGTGLGSSLFEEGRLAPHIELAHIPFRKGQTYEQQLGNRAFKRVGPERWNRRLQKAIEAFRALTFFDRLYLGGGNAEHVTFDLGKDIEIVSNANGLKGGIWLWKERSKQ